MPNLICPVRAVSVERHVRGPLRERRAWPQAKRLVPRPPWGAAGASFAAVDLPALRQRLRDQGALVYHNAAWNDNS